ncbi:MlaD family protein [Nocardioides sp. WS12]|uniref:MCE family protein n=1 Tax=Nocardioides sp. WS12 TaxID=2486272 RepID=UPI0015FA7144|nr:MlaD family protein [Nocardioides sp. WS12]
MLSRVTKTKLLAFVTITAITLMVTALYYVKLPQQVGIGRYDLRVELTNAGGLYPQAMVNYRGVEVGKVTAVDLQEDGSVLASLQVNDGVDIPANSIVEVRSASVIGEQYVNFLPPSEPSREILADGARIPSQQTVLPTTTNDLLSSVDGLLKSIPVGDLRTVVDELGKALEGAGDDLGLFVDASSTFQDAAQKNLPETLKLIDDSTTVLGTQQDLDPAIRSLAGSLESFTGQLEASNGELEGLIAAGQPFMDAIGGFALDLTGVAPGMLSELADVGEVLKVYRDGIEHILIVFPAVTAAFNAGTPVDRRAGPRAPVNLWFKLGFDPPTCTKGFEHAQSLRNPDDISPADAPSDSWCKVKPDDVRASRGARNSPCPNGGTGATAKICGLEFTKSVVSRGKGDEPRGADPLPLSGSLDLGLTSFLLSGDIPGATTWQDLLTGLVAQ